MSFSLPNFSVADTTADFKLFAKNGFYQVGQRVFNHKIFAMQEATRLGLDIAWNFNDDVYAKIDWSISTSPCLFDLYRSRAWQLRQKYKWLCLAWSGGGDSTTVLDSFLLNNIHLDEIVILWPYTRLRGRYTASLDTRPQNMASEWDYAIEPRLRWIQKNHPRVRVTVCDVMNELEREECKDDTVLIAEKHSYSVIQRWRALDSVLRQRTQEHDSVAGILAVDSPFLRVIDHKLCTYFDDMAANAGSKSDVMLDGWPRNIEFFYWTPDMPEIVREQGHAMLRFLNQYPMFRRVFAHWVTRPDGSVDQVSTESAEISRRVKKAVLYPTYDISTFQVQKQRSTHHSPEWFHWFHSDPHAAQFIEPWQHAVDAHQALIHPRFFVQVDNQIAQYIRCQSPLYQLGSLLPQNALNTMQHGEIEIGDRSVALKHLIQNDWFKSSAAT